MSHLKYILLFLFVIIIIIIISYIVNFIYLCLLIALSTKFFGLSSLVFFLESLYGSYTFTVFLGYYNFFLVLVFFFVCFVYVYLSLCVLHMFRPYWKTHKISLSFGSCSILVFYNFVFLCCFELRVLVNLKYRKKDKSKKNTIS